MMGRRPAFDDLLGASQVKKRHRHLALRPRREKVAALHLRRIERHSPALLSLLAGQVDHRFPGRPAGRLQLRIPVNVTTDSGLS